MMECKSKVIQNVNSKLHRMTTMHSVECGICPIAKSTITEMFLEKFWRFGH